MRYRTEKTIVDEKGYKFKIGDTVTVIYNKESGSYGGGFGEATITKITDTGFQFSIGGRRTKSVQFKNIEEIHK